LLRFKDIENRRWPKDAPCKAAYFTYQTLYSLINICGLKVMVRVENRRFFDGVRPLPHRPIIPAGSKTGTVANTTQHTEAKVAGHFEDELESFELTDGCVLGITTDNASSNYSMSHELQSTLEASGIECPAFSNHIPCMAHVRQLGLSPFMSSLRVRSYTKSWEACDCNQQFGETQGIDIVKSQ
jgi:hypothetical protein